MEKTKFAKFIFIFSVHRNWVIILIFFSPFPPSFPGSIGTSFQCHSIHQDHICTDDSDKVRFTWMFHSQDAYALQGFYILLLLHKDVLFCRYSSWFLVAFWTVSSIIRYILFSRQSFRQLMRNLFFVLYFYFFLYSFAVLNICDLPYWHPQLIKNSNGFSIF